MFAMAYSILKLHRKTLLKMGMADLIKFLQNGLASDFRYDDDYVIEKSLRGNLQDLRLSGLDHAGPPPDQELPQKPFCLADRRMRLTVAGERLATNSVTPTKFPDSELPEVVTGCLSCVLPCCAGSGK